MKLTFLKSKLHRATVTQADLNYEGSISIDPKLIAAANLHPYERVEIYNITNGERFATYVITGEPGDVCLNGAAARMVQPGDQVIICSYVELNEAEVKDHKPKVVLLDNQNQIKSASHTERPNTDIRPMLDA